MYCVNIQSELRQDVLQCTIKGFVMKEVLHPVSGKTVYQSNPPFFYLSVKVGVDIEAYQYYR